jgi:hypothetical protein
VTRERQLRLTRPAQRSPDVRRLTERQHALLAWIRTYGFPMDVDPLGRIFGYAEPRRACERLVRRGLAKKVRPGVYQAVVLRERKP